MYTLYTMGDYKGIIVIAKTSHQLTNNQSYDARYDGAVRQ